MVKRTLSLLLALIMTVGLMPATVVRAAENQDVVYVDETTSMSDLVDQGIVQMEQSATAPIMPETPTNGGMDSKQESDPVTQMPEPTPEAPKLSVCDCGLEDADIYHHGDTCALRLYYYRICDGAATQIYDLWRNVGPVTRGFLEDYLTANYPEKLAQVCQLIEAEAEPDADRDLDPDDAERLPGEASAMVDGVTVDALGVPEGSSLTVREPAADAVQIVEEIVAEAEEEPEQVFFYDISVQNDESEDWQPEATSVKMSISVPGLKLHKYAEVNILHVDDEGNTSTILGTLDENGSIVFETGGFSTFAGFTVDFAYGTALVSIPGKTSTTMGTLLEEMKMPLYASDIVDVQFTDYSLLTVTREEDDWRLTSLKAFSTHETLTFTMADGTVYEFVVTDATTPTIQTGSTGEVIKDGNDYTRWFAVGNGILKEGNSVGSWQSAYWAKDKIVYVNGAGSFGFGIAPDPNMDRTRRNCAVYMKQIRITGGTHVKVEVHPHFLNPGTEYADRTPWSNMKDVILCSYAKDSDTVDRSLFQVENGSLELVCEYPSIDFCLRGSYHYTENGVDKKIYTTDPLITLGAGATSFTAKNITFYNGHDGGIYSKATNVSAINLTDCIFEKTVYREGGNGGAIYLSGQQGSTSAGYRTIGEVNLTRCEFQGNLAGSHGGAIYFGDTVGRIRITDCKFDGCKAGLSGGAIAFRGNFGKVSITGSDSAGTDDSKKTIFMNCEAATNGGAINVETVQQNVDGTWVKDKENHTHYSRIHTLNLSGVKFNSCKARGDYTYVDGTNGITKGNNDGTGGAINLAVQLQNLNLNHCEFDGCESGGQYTNLGGAGICFGYSNLGDTPISATNNQYQIYGGKPALKGWNAPATWTEKDENGNPVTKGTADARSLTMGYEHEDNGVKYTRQRNTYGDVRIENTTFKNGKSHQGGGFIVRTGVSIENLDVITVKIDSCEATVSGSAVVFQNCTVGTADFTDCTFSNCRVTKAINEGGGTVRSVGQTGTVLTLTRCHFLGNAGNIAGGGLYWNAAANKISVGQYAAGKREPNETMVTLINCDFQRNTALVDETVKDYKEVTDENGNVILDIVTGAAQLEVLKDSAGNESRYRRVGGGIFCEAKMVITGCTFTGNRSLLGGGLCMGVYNSDYRKFEPDETTELELDPETVFSYNVAKNGGGLAIRANATKAIDNDKEINHTIEFILGGAEVHHNFATETGGGIYYIAESYVADPNNPDYDPELDNAEVRRLIKKITINDGTIYSNRAVLDGGGIYVESDYNTTVGVSNGTIYGNKAGTRCGENSSAIGMIATNTGEKDENGNDIYTYALEQDYISTQGGNGGGIYVNGADALVNITGGVIGAYWSNDTLIDKGNSAYGRSGNLNSGYGGGIAVYGGANVTMSDGDVVYNVAHRNGGGIAANDGAEVTMTGGNIQHNKADRRNYADGHGAYSGVGGGIALANSTMIYSNGTISDNTAYNGGGIALSESNMTFTNGTIQNNAAAVAGGGISVHNQSTMYVSNGTISNNQAVVGGGISVNNSAGDDSSTDETKQYGMYLDGGNVTNNHVIPCTFTNADTGTSAYGGGICVAADSDMKISGGTITGNTAASDVEATTYASGQEGGGIAVCQNSTMEISGGTVKENKAYSGGGIVIRGGSTVTMSGTLVENAGEVDLEKSTGIIVSNHADRSGGGVFLTGADSTFTMSNGCINNNSCTTQTTEIANCKGGGVFVDEGTSFTLTGGLIDGNKAADGGGILVYYGAVTINGGYLIGNEVHRHGGAIYSDYSTVTVNGGEFANNKAHGTSGYYTPGEGGAIFSYGSETDPSIVSITGGNFHDNYAKKNGGAVSVEGNGTFTVSNGTFKSNTSPGNGGAFYAGTVTCTISGGTFTENSSTGGSGGGAYFSGSKVEIGGGTFTKNSAKVHGGAAYFDNADTTISNGSFTSNTAASNAGALAVRNGTFELTGGTFTSNTATKSGGGAYFNGSTVTISGGTFTENSSTGGSGGGAYFNTGTIDISGGTFIKNFAQENGGAAYFHTADTTISDGIFTSNTATGNAGAVSVRNGTFELTGGTFTSNTADKAGGGLYVNGGTITLGGGQFTGNVSKTYGGGANLSGASVTFTEGTFDENVARSGGGLSIVQSTVEFDGGTFENNIADRGGAVFIRSAGVTIDTITVNNNHAKEDSRYGTSSYRRGGGICVDTAGTGPANVTINGGTFTGNTAKYGGGLWINNNATVKEDGDTDGPVGNTATLTVNGGTVSGNTASSQGGGIWISGSSYISDTECTSLTMNGGIISNNKTSGHGGGIWAGGLAQVSILATDTTHGEITGNTARNGGGVFITSGADLTVTNGYITYNKADQGKQTSPGSPYQVNDGLLYGVGGGICVTTGTAGDPSTFTLNKVEGNNKMAIYGNTATFAADDVFANGSNTQLNVPQVADMDLVGYGFKPEGWFEDYNTQDANYKYGLDMVTVNGGTVTKLEGGETDGVLRYRNANAVQRRYMHITPPYVSATGVNKSNAYVAMTLGIPAAADDTVVIDFGSMVSIDVWKNDLFMDEEDFANTKNSQSATVHHSYIGPEMPKTQIKDGVHYDTKKPTTTTANGFYQYYFRGTTNGQVYNRKNGIMTFEPEKLVMDQEVTFFYMVEHNTVWYYANVTVVPATSIYFEDNEVDKDNKTLVTYHTQSTVEKLAQWQTIGTAAEEKQDQDRPGASILEGLDADNIYGYDGNYSTTSTYSNGSAHWVTVTRDRTTKETTSARASFTFTGTGFDIVSLCKANTGIVMVSVYRGEVVDFDKPPFDDRYITSYIVDTHYGYVYNIETGKWELAEDSATALYQVPVIKVDLTNVRVYEDDPTTDEYDPKYSYKDYGYGTYTAEIYVSNSFLEREPGYWSADFYLDAIRIYNPAGYDGIYSYEYDAVKRDTEGNPMYDTAGNPLYEKVTKSNATDTIKNAYKDDAESWPVYAELRNMFIAQKDLNVEGTNGVIFIDGQENPSLADYKSWGPNNEVYLNPGQSVAFTLDAAGYAQNVASVQVGLRGLTGAGNVLVQSKASNQGYYTKILERKISTTDLYYDISSKDAEGNLGVANKVITITNPEYIKDAQGTNVKNTVPIAITNIKVTHSGVPTQDLTTYFMANDMTKTVAVEILTAEQLADPEVTPEYPTLSFDGMVRYHVFFSAENLGQITPDDLGLAVFGSYDPEGTVETAKDVVMGATAIDGRYMIATNGVHAKYLGDQQYFRVFAKKNDGSIVYSKMVNYSAVDYSKNALANSADPALRQLAVALLNYGAQAQKFFGYKTDDLINKDLTADDQALLSGFDAHALKSIQKADASKMGEFASTGGFIKKAPAISFKGAFEINYFFTPAHAVDGDMKLYFWNEDTYNSVTELTAENADKAVVMELKGGAYAASSHEIAAKHLDKTLYVAAVYESNGVTYCSGVLPYSIAAYCQNPPAGVQELAVAAAIYGCTAKQYFGV